MAGYRVSAQTGLPPRRIRCPKCDTRYYALRTETKKYLTDGFFEIECTCGCRFQVINKGRTSIIRRKSV